MADPERNFHPIVTAAALGLGALAVSEFRKYRAHRHEFYSPLAYAKDRWLDITAPFMGDDRAFSFDSIVAGSRQYMQRFTKKAKIVTPNEWGPDTWVKTWFGEDSASGSAHSVASEKHPNRNEDHAFSDTRNQSAGAFDGVSGNRGSELAAAIASNVCKEELSQIRPMQPDVTKTLAMMKDIMHKADRAITATGKNIGTTGVFAKLFKNDRSEAYVAGAVVEDSRGYLYRDGRIHFVTFDAGYNAQNVPDHVRDTQTALATVTDWRELTPELQYQYRQRNIIYSMLGDHPKITTFWLPTRKGDRFILTSDGIHDNLTMEEMERIIRDNPYDDDLVNALTSKAQERSRTDHPRAKADDMTAGVITYRMSGVTQTVTDHNARLGA